MSLAAALALLEAHDQLPVGALDGWLVWGDWWYDDSIRPARGTLLVADLAQRFGLRLLVPHSARQEAAYVPGVPVYGVRNLGEALDILRNHASYEPWCNPATSAPATWKRSVDFSTIAGLRLPKLAAEVSLAGGHHLLLHGASATGKTLLTRAMAGVMPNLTPEHSNEVMRVLSSVRSLKERRQYRPPTRGPHYTVSSQGLIGGGKPTRPGEVSLAHRGLLVLDDLPEFERRTYDDLRESLETRVATHVSSSYAHHYPAAYTLVGTMMLCPRGCASDACACMPASQQRYQGRVKVIAKHFALAVRCEPEPPDPEARDSDAILERVLRARARQQERWAGQPWYLNGASSDAEAEQLELTPRARELEAERGCLLAARRVARTIQDLDPDGQRAIEADSLAQAWALRVFPSQG